MFSLPNGQSKRALWNLRQLPPHNLENSLGIRELKAIFTAVQGLKRGCFLCSHPTGKTSREEEDSAESSSEVKINLYDLQLLYENALLLPQSSCHNIY